MKAEDDTAQVKVLTGSISMVMRWRWKYTRAWMGLWTYTTASKGIEILRYNSNDIDITVPGVIDNKNVVSIDSASHSLSLQFQKAL